MDDVNAPLRRWGVPLAPFAFSLLLSLSTAGSTVFWQDSGYCLIAIREFAVLYPHGFVLYETLAKLWSFAVAPLAGFTLSIHLFSAFCAAGAASLLALAARDVLRKLWPDGPSDGPAVAAALVTAAGYSFWNASTLAKPYAFYYLTLALLLRLLVRAETKRDFLLAGAVLGLAGAAHPSALLLLPAMAAFARARRDNLRELGVRGIAAVVGIAAATAFLPSLIGLPILAARESVVSLGDPRSAGQIVGHLRGANYMGFEGAWGLDLDRAALAARFIWEEFLGVGLAVLAIGLWRFWTDRRGALGLLAAWIGPTLLLPLVFVGEGMFDQWFVAAYLPLALATAAGFAWLARKARVAFPAAIATAAAWMIFANYRDLNFRNYDFAQVYGELLIQPLPQDAIYVGATDDGAAIPLYLQRLRDVRKDVKVVHGEFVGLDWYDRRIERDYGVKPGRVRELEGKVNPQLLAVTAIANANVAPGRPVFSEHPPDPRGLRPGLAQAAAGVLWKTAVEAEAVPDLSIPRVDPFAVSRQRRRARGIFMRHTAKGAVAQFEPYENRLIGLLVQAKLRETEPQIGKSPDALKILLGARALDPSLEVDAVFQYNFGLALYLANQFAPAKEAFEKVLTLEPLPARETLANFYLAEIARVARQPEVAKKHYARALEISGAEPLMMKTIRIRASQ